MAFLFLLVVCLWQNYQRVSLQEVGLCKSAACGHIYRQFSQRSEGYVAWGDAIDSQVTGGREFWLVGGLSVHFWRDWGSPRWPVSRMGDYVGSRTSLLHMETWEQSLRV